LTKKLDVKRLCLVGATGLVGRSVIEHAVNRWDIRIVAVARREMPLPKGSRMEMLVADPSAWSDAIAASNAGVLVCALGTTMRKSGGDREVFRAVDHDLVMAAVRAAKEAGIDHAIVVSSVGADPAARNDYLRVKGETEIALNKLGLRRLDILHPGLLVGARQEARPLEKLAMWLSPALDRFLRGKYRQYRSIKVGSLADAILALAKQKAGGRFVHDQASMVRAIRRAGDDLAESAGSRLT